MLDPPPVGVRRPSLLKKRKPDAEWLWEWQHLSLPWFDGGLPRLPAHAGDVLRGVLRHVHRPHPCQLPGYGVLAVWLHEGLRPLGLAVVLLQLRADGPPQPLHERDVAAGVLHPGAVVTPARLPFTPSLTTVTVLPVPDGRSLPWGASRNSGCFSRGPNLGFEAMARRASGTAAFGNPFHLFLIKTLQLKLLLALVHRKGSCKKLENTNGLETSFWKKDCNWHPLNVAFEAWG